MLCTKDKHCRFSENQLNSLAYLSLFGAAFIAATLLPAQSEALLAALLVASKYKTWLLVLSATAGNVLGSLVNWRLGVCIEKFREKSWFPFSKETMDRAISYYSKYGRWSLLLSWAPVIGDPLTLIAGVMREPLWRFLIIVTAAKLGRYAVVTFLVLGLF